MMGAAGSKSPNRAGVLLGGAALACLSMVSADAHAQAVDSTEEIIVTATKREVAIQDVPLSVTAISAETLRDTGANEFADYATSVPNLSFGFAGEGRQTSRNFQLRGIFGADTSALYIGDTAVPTTMDPRVIDLERVEVLRGPQGSLFGARSMGGLVRLVPRGPDLEEQSFDLHTSYGLVDEGGDDYAVDATANIVLGSEAALRITAYYLQDAGFIDRLIDPDASFIARPLISSVPFQNGDEYLVEDVNEDETFGFQVALRAEPTESLTITPRIMYQRTDSRGPSFVDNDVENLVKVRQYDVEETGEDEWFLGSLEINLDVGNGEWVSSTSFFTRSTLDIEDSTLFMGSNVGGRVRQGVGAPTTTREATDSDRFTQELRFVSQFDGPLQVVAGGFFQDVSTDGGFPPDSIIPPGARLLLFGFTQGASFYSSALSTDQTEWGIFGEIDYEILPELTLTLGGRYFNIETETFRDDSGELFTVFAGFDPAAEIGSQQEEGFNPRIALTWEPTEEVTLYGNVARGFRPGRVNATVGVCAALGETVPDSVSSDSLWNYELGGKFSLFNNALQLNTAVYHMIWEDRQTQTFNCGGLGFGALENVGEAESTGAEVEILARPFEGFEASVGLGFTDASVTDTGGLTSVSVGDPLANVPEFNGALSLAYERPITAALSGYARTDYRYVGESESAQGNTRDDYALVNLRFGVRTDRWDISLFGQNLTDERANLADPTELSDALNLIAVSRPRTIGIDVRARF